MNEMPAHKRLNSKKPRKEFVVNSDYLVNEDSAISSPESPMSPPGIQNGHTIPPPSNGRATIEFTRDEKIANLTKLNSTLVREVASLRMDKDNLRCRVQELEKQLHDDLVSKDGLLCENLELKTYKEDVLTKISALEREKNFLSGENVFLGKEKLALVTDKEHQEIALLEARQNLADILEQMEQSEISSAACKARMDAEIHKLLSENKILSEENKNLKLVMRETEEKLEKLATEQLIMKNEQQSLIVEVEKAVENADSASQSMEALRSKGISLEDNQVMLEFEKEKVHVIDTLKQLKMEVAVLRNELNLARSEEAKALLDLEKERESTREFMREVSQAASSKKVLEESLNSSLTSLDKTQEIAKRKDSQVLSLEECVALLSKEIADIQKSWYDMELHLQTQITLLTKEISSRMAENLVLKQKISSLETLQGNMKKKAKWGERTVWEILSELRSVHALFHKNAQVAKYAVPVTAVSSGTLAFVGLLAYLRFRKKHKAGACL